MIAETLAAVAEFVARRSGDLLFDLLDIGVVAVVVYRVLLVVRGTRAVQMGIGLGFVFVVYQLARRFGLLTLYSLLDGLLASVVLIVVVIFQSEIRRGLMRFGGRAWWLAGRSAKASGAIEEVVKAATLLAQKRIGALIVFERDAMLDEFIQRGTLLDALPTKELLYGLFIPSFENPLHDGAVIVRDGRLWQAGAFLPLTTNAELDRTLGTRHRAALGISEETDAVVLVVSEERGAVSLVFNGNMVRDVDAASLRDALPGLLFRRARSKKRGSAKQSVAGLRVAPAPRADPTLRTVAQQRGPDADPQADVHVAEVRAADEVDP